MHKGMMTSKTYEYETPQAFFDELDREFHFVLDPCATDENHKCDIYFTKADDALSKNWTDFGPVFMNPPYGREISRWVEKAYETARIGRSPVVCLLPARTDTSWWHDYCTKGEIRFIRGRLRFSKLKSNAPFPCAVVIFRAADIQHFMSQLKNQGSAGGQ